MQPPGGVFFPLFPSCGQETDGHFGSKDRSEVKRRSDAVVTRGVGMPPPWRDVLVGGRKCCFSLPLMIFARLHDMILDQFSVLLSVHKNGKGGEVEEGRQLAE